MRLLVSLLFLVTQLTAQIYPEFGGAYGPIQLCPEADTIYPTILITDITTFNGGDTVNFLTKDLTSHDLDYLPCADPGTYSVFICIGADRWSIPMPPNITGNVQQLLITLDLMLPMVPPLPNRNYYTFRVHVPITRDLIGLEFYFQSLHFWNQHGVPQLWSDTGLRAIVR